MLDTQVVLINIRGVEMWINQEDESAAIDREKARIYEINIGSWRAGWERIRRAVRTVRIGEIGHVANLTGRNGIQEQARVTEEGRLPVELKIVFALQYVVKNSAASADARLAVPPWVPSESESRGKVIFVGEIYAAGSAMIPRKNHAERRVWKPCGLKSWNYRETSALRVEFGRAVFLSLIHI